MNTEEKAYCVYVHTAPNGVYYGVTCNVKQRWQPSKYKLCTSFYEAIIEFGWKNIKHEVLYSGLTRDKALEIEGLLIIEARKNGVCLNSNRSGHYQQTDEFKEENKAYHKSYSEEHKEDKAAYDKTYNEEHKEEKSANAKDYYEVHKDEINARSKAWNEAHPEECKAIQKRYYEKNKDKINARRRERRNRNKGSK